LKCGFVGMVVFLMDVRLICSLNLDIYFELDFLWMFDRICNNPYLSGS